MERFKLLQNIILSGLRSPLYDIDLDLHLVSFVAILCNRLIKI